MKKLIETLKNCWRVEDLRQRLLVTFLFTAIYRFGSFVVLPGIDPGKLVQLQSQTKGGLMSLLDMFSGGAFSNASIFALGIMPYISASIVMQLLAVAVPYFQKMQREGESGRKRIQWYTRILTVAILLFQAPSYLINLKMQAGSALASGVSWSVFMIPATIILAAGSMFILWLGERITDKGVGNGISLIIMLGIIARLPQAFFQEVSSRFTAISGGGLVMFIVEILILYGVICAAILLTQGTRKVPVQYAKRLVGNKQYGGGPGLDGAQDAFAGGAAGGDDGHGGEAAADMLHHLGRAVCCRNVEDGNACLQARVDIRLLIEHGGHDGDIHYIRDHAHGIVGQGGVDHHADRALGLRILGQCYGALARGGTAAHAAKHRHVAGGNDGVGDGLLGREGIDRQHRVRIAIADDGDICRKYHGFDALTQYDHTACLKDLPRHGKDVGAKVACDLGNMTLCHS